MPVCCLLPTVCCREEVEVDDRKFYFDATTLEHKRANEKRELVCEFTTKRDDGR